MKFEKNKVIAFIVFAVAMTVFFPMAFFDMDATSGIKGLIAFSFLLLGSLIAIIVGSSNSSQSH